MKMKTSLMLNINAMKHAVWAKCNPKEYIKAEYIGALFTGWGTFKYNGGESELYCNVDHLHRDVLFNSSPKGTRRDIKVGFRGSEGYIQWNEDAQQVPKALRARAHLISRDEFKQQNRRHKSRSRSKLTLN